MFSGLETIFSKAENMVFDTLTMGFVPLAIVSAIQTTEFVVLTMFPVVLTTVVVTLTMIIAMMTTVSVFSTLVFGVEEMVSSLDPLFSEKEPILRISETGNLH